MVDINCSKPTCIKVSVTFCVWSSFFFLQESMEQKFCSYPDRWQPLCWNKKKESLSNNLVSRKVQGKWCQSHGTIFSISKINEWENAWMWWESGNGEKIKCSERNETRGEWDFSKTLNTHCWLWQQLSNTLHNCQNVTLISATRWNAAHRNAEQYSNSRWRFSSL